MNVSQRKIANNLNYLLADYEIYLHKLLRYQWKIQASDSPEVSELFSRYSEDVEEQIEMIVERVMHFDITPVSTLANWMRKSKLPYKTDIESSEKIIKHVLQDSQSLENAASNLREQAIQANDATTATLAKNIKKRNARRIEKLLQFTQEKRAIAGQ